jgi:hypothetical protein
MGCEIGQVRLPRAIAYYITLRAGQMCIRLSRQLCEYLISQQVECLPAHLGHQQSYLRHPIYDFFM